jgi:hypothetical protein
MENMDNEDDTKKMHTYRMSEKMIKAREAGYLTAAV